MIENDREAIKVFFVQVWRCCPLFNILLHYSAEGRKKNHHMAMPFALQQRIPPEICIL